MDIEPEKPSDEAVGCVIGIALMVGIIAWYCGHADGQLAVQQEAIKAGAAKWEADEKGNTHIKWLPAAEAQKP